MFDTRKILLTLFGISLFMIWRKNRRNLIYPLGGDDAAFIRIVLTYSSIIGLWYVFNLYVALAAFVLKVIVNKVTRQYFWYQVFKQWTALYTPLVEQAASAEGWSSTNKEINIMAQNETFKRLKGITSRGVLFGQIEIGLTPDEKEKAYEEIRKNMADKSYATQIRG